MYKKRLVIFFSIIIFGIIIFGISVFYNKKKEIDIEVKENYYTEKEISDLEYLLKEYMKKEYSKEEIRQMIIFHLLNSQNDHYYYFSNEESISDYIDKIVNENYSTENYPSDLDYHKIAVSTLESFNDELHDKNVAEGLMILDEISEVVISLLFSLIYTFIALGFVLLKKFDKKSLKKDIIKYIIALIMVFFCNIIAVMLEEKAINYLGSYKVNAYEISKLPNKLDYGVLSITSFAILIVVSIALYFLINIKYIKKLIKM